MAEAMGSPSAAGSRSCPRTCFRFHCTAACRSEPRLLPSGTECSIAAGTSGTRVGTGRCWVSHWLLPFRPGTLSTRTARAVALSGLAPQACPDDSRRGPGAADSRLLRSNCPLRGVFLPRLPGLMAAVVRGGVPSLCCRLPVRGGPGGGGGKPPRGERSRFGGDRYARSRYVAYGWRGCRMSAFGRVGGDSSTCGPC